MRPLFASGPFFSHLILISLISFEAAFVASSSNNRDSQLLLGFKASLPDQSVLQNWVPNQDPCSFSGVTCQGSGVSSVELGYTLLNTDFHSVAAFLLALKNLEYLSLMKAGITGNISFRSGSKCSSLLTTLDLSQNTLSGPVSTVSALASCSNLKFLNLSTNSLVSSGGEESRGLQLSLEVLDLSFNKLSAVNVVPWILHGGCNELKHLALKGNEIAGEIDVSNCRKLKILDVSWNNFSMGNPSLEAAQLWNSLISPAIILYLADNKFQGQVPLYLTEACSTLVELVLSSNNLSGMLPTGFASCSSLKSFDVSTNNFTGRLPIEIFQNMNSLKKLGLAFNYFSGPLPESLSSLFNLEALDLSSNRFSGSIPISLCENPTNRLQVLYLHNNILIGSIPASLSNCSQLVSLHLSFNYLTGTIPTSLGALSKLKDLRLWLNQLHGEIPRELSYIQTLETLILDFNELSGAIPSGLSNCTKLNWISLSNNRFTGEIPASLGKLSSHAILKLSNNSFYGRIPPELGDCQSLIWLDLNTNYLNGTIPPVLFKHSGKIAVNFIAGKRYMYAKNDGSKECHGSGNLLEFSGIRQEQLGRISSQNPCNFTRVYGGHTQPTFNDNGSMIFLDLSYNLLLGAIPKEIGTMPYLFILNLGHNNISGTIPQEIGNLKGLGILDLSYNRSLWFPSPPCENSAAASGSEHRKSHCRQASLAGSVAMGLLFSLFCIFGVIIVIVETKKRRKKQESSLDVYMDSCSHSGATNTSWKLTGAREALSINLATFEKPLRKFTFADLLEATNGFHDDSLIGSGGFGDVYKAQLKDGSVVAIKKLIHIVDKVTEKRRRWKPLGRSSTRTSFHSWVTVRWVRNGF
ncbi:systemin receptor SR160-like [Hibiscus syriacus]|uniref:systemin receptor SR160-like n=1 Tax=Hibiscus syriacus TaxID=106335 RepID=UPI001923E83A|nr:systemin receptor SR160-like [Hibiscus syriacus]